MFTLLYPYIMIQLALFGLADQDSVSAIYSKNISPNGSYLGCFHPVAGLFATSVGL